MDPRAVPGRGFPLSEEFAGCHGLETEQID
jgi:hypothetical protein